MKPVKVGICGLGTVGGGTFNVLQSNASSIAARTGRPVIIEQVGARRDNPDCDTGSTSVTLDIFEVAHNPDIDILVGTIGGYDVTKQKTACPPQTLAFTRAKPGNGYSFCPE